jgi:D-tyrosyl-tRNA(Tyr) deacylase
LIARFVALLREQGLRVETGKFQAHMLVQISNDGPVTIILDSP